MANAVAQAQPPKRAGTILPNASVVAGACSHPVRPSSERGVGANV